MKEIRSPRGQVLAVFDSRPQIEADLEALDAQIRTDRYRNPLATPRGIARYSQKQPKSVPLRW